MPRQYRGLQHSTTVRSASFGEGARTERLSRLKRVWRIVRAHLIGEVPIDELDLGRTSASAPPSEARARPATDAATEASAERDASIRDASIDEASDDSFPASDPPSSNASRV